MSNQAIRYRICQYDDGVNFCVEELIEGEWQYWSVMRPTPGTPEIYHGDRLFTTVDAAKEAVDRKKSREKPRVLFEM